MPACRQAIFGALCLFAVCCFCFSHVGISPKALMSTSVPVYSSSWRSCRALPGLVGPSRAAVRPGDPRHAAALAELTRPLAAREDVGELLGGHHFELREGARGDRFVGAPPAK